MWIYLVFMGTLSPFYILLNNNKMGKINLIDTFTEFKELKNIDRATMMRVLEDVFRSMLTKKYGTDEFFDIIINIDKGSPIRIYPIPNQSKLIVY